MQTPARKVGQCTITPSNQFRRENRNKHPMNREGLSLVQSSPLIPCSSSRQLWKSSRYCSSSALAAFV
jgi:hypothetical protein